MDQTQEKLYTIRELAALLRISVASVYELVKRGKIAVLRVGAAGGAMRFRKCDVDLYLASCLVCNEPVPLAAPKSPHAKPRLRHITINRPK